MPAHSTFYTFTEILNRRNSQTGLKWEKQIHKRNGHTFIRVEGMKAWIEFQADGKLIGESLKSADERFADEEEERRRKSVESMPDEKLKPATEMDDEETEKFLENRHGM